MKLMNSVRFLAVAACLSTFYIGESVSAQNVPPRIACPTEVIIQQSVSSLSASENRNNIFMILNQINFPKETASLLKTSGELRDAFKLASSTDEMIRISSEHERVSLLLMNDVCYVSTLEILSKLLP
jgi:hypothetical protein